ncbi:Fic family protein [Nocardia beijingensis]|uniref:Fic/DOC family protein n=1 Tax=Nocardia beijingensis TaxID=95162 RepID=UPI00344E840E
MSIEAPYDHDTLWQAYLWPSDTGEMMLRNRYGLHNEAELARREHRETAKRELEIRSGKVDIPVTGDLTEWRAIHAHLFGNVYDWAGQLRTVGMSKSGRDFLHPLHFDSFLPATLADLRAVPWAQLDRFRFVEYISYNYMRLNWAHPFREGNGRALGIFLDRQIADARYALDYSRLGEDPSEWNHAAWSACPEKYGAPTDYRPLLRIFSRITVARSATSTPTLDPTDPHHLETILATIRHTAQGHETGDAIAAAGLTGSDIAAATLPPADQAAQQVTGHEPHPPTPSPEL